MIPKTIHYVWCGDTIKPDLIIKCIESWKRYCPDYKFIEWNNSSLKKIRNRYVSEAFEKKQWAFVSDYLRLYALYFYGGFYFDTDLELRDNIEVFRQYDFVSGYEKYEGKIQPITTAFMGSCTKNTIIKDLLNEYKCIHFIKNDGSYDTTTNTGRVSKYFEYKFGLKPPYEGENKLFLCPNSVIFPYFYFCVPKDGYKNYSIHHFRGSWLEIWRRKNILNIFNYSLVKFKKVIQVNNKESILPLSKNEMLLFIFPFYKNKLIAVIKRIINND
jgi:hypothetical protein